MRFAVERAKMNYDDLIQIRLTLKYTKREFANFKFNLHKENGCSKSYPRHRRIAITENTTINNSSTYIKLEARGPRNSLYSSMQINFLPKDKLLR